MGNRIDEEVCLQCGTPLIYPFNQIRCCSKCTEIILRETYRTKMEGSLAAHGKGKKKRGKPVSGRFYYSPDILGEPVEY